MSNQKSVISDQTMPVQILITDYGYLTPGSPPPDNPRASPRIVDLPPPGGGKSLHRALVMEAVLIILEDGGRGLERVVAVGVLDRVLQVKVLDREVIVAVFVRPAHRGVVGLAHLLAHGVLLGQVALHRRDRAVDEVRGCT